MTPVPQIYLYIDDVQIAVKSTGYGISIESDGVYIGVSTDPSWYYSGVGTFLGFSRTQGATNPDSDLEVGDNYYLNVTTYLYSVAQTQSTGKTQFGPRAITKKMFGTREITKEVLNGVTIYEKQAPTPSTISFTIEFVTYQADAGMTWGQWVNSAYNTNNKFAISGDYVYDTQVGGYVFDPNLGVTLVTITDNIVSGKNYAVQGGN